MYGWGVPAFVLTQLASRAFFAHQDTKTPMQFALVSVAVNIGAGVTLFHFVGVWGIAAATSLAAWLNLVQMLVALWRRRMYRLSAQAFSRVVRIGLAGLMLGLMLGAAAHFRDLIQAPFAGAHLGRLLGTKEIAVVLTAIVAVAVYPPLLFAFGGLNLSELKAALRRQPKDPTLEEEIEQDLGKTPAGPDLL
jgi:putative peptidoglycan lipid II flippase